ncbi:MAG: hypothetical protein NVS9B7_26240 [Flavisolibacter sp.]
MLKSGKINVINNLRQSYLDTFNQRSARVNNKAFGLLQFDKIPSQDTRKDLASQGIELLEYIPQNSYTATIKGFISLNVLRQAGANAFIQLAPEQKMEPRLAKGLLPSWAIKIAGTIDVSISFPKTFTAHEVMADLKKLNFDIQSASFQQYRILSLRISIGRLRELAALPYVEYVQPTHPADQPLNHGSRNASRANILNALISNGGKGLNGEGVTVGIGDNADVQEQPDFAGRLIDRAVAPFAGHGTHTTGTMTGAGNLDENYRGFAPKSTIVSQAFNGILDNAATYVSDYNMVVTNNSYGNVIDCSYYGTYDLYSRVMDQMAFDLPHLQNVFATGNSGNNTCAPYLLGYGTVLGSYQSAKNVISVGATTDSGLLGYYSSRGPVKDGRTKPEITAKGYGVISDWPISTYHSLDGTSQAAPAVSGGIALLYQRYRQLNGGADPENALIKAIICNGASDKGNPGPDFSFGYGFLNLSRSVDMVEKHHYFISTLSNGQANTHSISIPNNTAQVKIMLYWNDPAASLISSRTLVNDLDLKVTDPSSTSFLPFVLDTLSSNVGLNATNGMDHINNMEQVVINNPMAGNYSINVLGTAIAQNPQQQYIIVYDLIDSGINISAPGYGESLEPTNTTGGMVITWDAYGLSPGNCTLEFSADNGATWSTIQTGVNINRNYYSWIVPNIPTTKAFIRITKNITGESAISKAFTILDRPIVSLDSVQCEGYINIKWTPVIGATDYEIMMLKGDDMKSIATTSSNAYVISGLSKDTVYWFTVRARLNGTPGKRGGALFRQPNSGTCIGSISDNDLKVDSIVSPITGRIFTASQLGATSKILVRIKNLDDNPVNNYTVSYAINGGAWISEAVATPIAAGASVTHTFATTADLSVPGFYTITAVVKNAVADPVPSNDTLISLVNHINNQPLDLTTSFLDNFENALVETYLNPTIGLDSITRYDFDHNTLYGRLRTFVNSGFAYSGSKALTLDQNRYDPAGTTNYLTGTYNLSFYSANSADVRVDFQYNNHGQNASSKNRVWIRGNDSQPWIQAFDLDSNENNPGIYKKTRSIEISPLLQSSGQDFSPSFQVRWGQYGQYPATDKGLSAQGVSAGYTFDDIRLYRALNDLQMLSIDSPQTTSCNLSKATKIKITIRNASNAAVTNVLVKYAVNNAAWIQETIPSIAAKTIIQYSFATPADLSAWGDYSLKTVVDFPSDNFRENDTATMALKNLPLISTFPYLENFENGVGFWYSSGQNSSWEYGTPNSSKINRAASGAKAWKTRLVGNYNDNEFSFLYSPCFDISSLTKPTLSFSVALDLEDCGSTLCDGGWVEYSSDGVSWKKLGAFASGTNWYNKSTDQLWSVRGYSRWHVATIALPSGLNTMHLRFVLQSDPSTNYEGIAIDDIHIYDKSYPIYDSTTLVSPVSRFVSGNNWISFTANGKIIASIQPGNQVLGNTLTHVYCNKSGVRHTTTQYYHDRNLTIKPALINPIDSVGIRFYFLDSEGDSMIFATSCPACSNISSSYELGVTKYSDPDTSVENGTIADNNSGMWNFISPDNLTKVPYDKGYYWEFKVKNFSEFWLNNGGLGQDLPLPIKLLRFTIQKQNASDVWLQWSVASEYNVDHYEIELARGNLDLQNGRFTSIGQTVSQGNSSALHSYNFIDNQVDKFGIYYYRLKTINLDGSYFYSPIRSIQFSPAVLWQVYPNPSNGLFYLVYQTNNARRFTVRIQDAKGSLVKKYQLFGNGLPQKLSIDLSKNNYASGVYLLQTEVNNQVFKLYKK